MCPAHSRRIASHPLAALQGLLLLFFLSACGFGERADVLILVRAEDPIARAVAEAYASGHEIPMTRILELPLNPARNRDEIDRSRFDSEIAAPIESYLARHDPERRISILVTTLGLPLLVSDCREGPPRTRTDRPECAWIAVDAALATLGRRPIEGGLGDSVNPYFQDRRSFERFRREEPEAPLRFLVARLTGPASPLDARTQIPVALQGLVGPGLEAESLTAPPRWQIASDSGPGRRGIGSTALLESVRKRLEAHRGPVCDPCPLDEGSPPPVGVIFDADMKWPGSAAPFERLSRPGIVIALGRAIAPGDPAQPENAGGAGSSRDSGVTGKEAKRPDGARPDLEGFRLFVAAALARGARAISTHLGDPGLAGVVRPTPQVEGWLAGRMAVEAHFRSVPHLGWVNVFVGDPLVRLGEIPASTIEVDFERDRDGDGVPDDRDNCLELANPDQRDSNGDRLGNLCDPDVDNDGRVETSRGQIYPVDARGDLEAIALTARNGPYDPDHDLDGDGRVDERDLALAELWLFRAPGPSGHDVDFAGFSPSRSARIKLDVSHLPPPRR